MVQLMSVLLFLPLLPLLIFLLFAAASVVVATDRVKDTSAAAATCVNVLDNLEDIATMLVNGEECVRTLDAYVGG